MKEVLRTNDPVLLASLLAFLEGQGIEAIVFDTHASILEGSVTAIPRRVMVIDEDEPQALDILKKLEAGKAHEL